MMGECMYDPPVLVGRPVVGTEDYCHNFSVEDFSMECLCYNCKYFRILEEEDGT